MKIEIYFYNNYKTVKEAINKAYIDRGFLKVIDVRHYHILHDPNGDLLAAIRRASQNVNN